MPSDSRASSASDSHDDRGAGGKLVRRRRQGAVIPYQRPPERSRGWLSGLVAGAGRLVSAVFRSREPEEEDDGIREDCDENQGMQSVEDHEVDARELLAAKSSAKLTIEQLLLKEKFTRSECDRLIEIIQSRVVDSPMLEDICDEAVLEAKNWVKEKSSMSSKATQNTSDNANDKGSPVNVAKSYMQTLPRRSSPTKASGIRTQSIKACSENIESSYAKTSHTLSALQDLERKDVSVGPFNDLDTTRSPCQGTSEKLPGSSVFGQFTSSDKLIESQAPEVMDGETPKELPLVHESAVPAKCSPEASTDIPTESEWRTSSSNGGNATKISPLNNGVCTETEPKVQIEIFSSQQELGEFAFDNELVHNIAPQENHPSTLPIEHQGVVEFMNAEPISVVSEKTNPTLPSSSAGLKEISSSSKAIPSIEDHNSTETTYGAMEVNEPEDINEASGQKAVYKRRRGSVKPPRRQTRKETSRSIILTRGKQAATGRGRGKGRGK